MWKISKNNFKRKVSGRRGGLCYIKANVQFGHSKNVNIWAKYPRPIIAVLHVASISAHLRTIGESFHQFYKIWGDQMCSCGFSFLLKTIRKFRWCVVDEFWPVQNMWKILKKNFRRKVSGRRGGLCSIKGTCNFVIRRMWKFECTHSVIVALRLYNIVERLPRGENRATNFTKNETADVEL